MNAELKSCRGCAKYAALSTTVALVIWAPAKIAARTAGRGVSGGDGGSEMQKTAAEAFKNIQVLKDIPASELIPSMRYVSAALAVGCDCSTRLTISTAMISR